MKQFCSDSIGIRLEKVLIELFLFRGVFRKQGEKSRREIRIKRC